jgi:plasmid stabilization system protein ParE
VKYRVIVQPDAEAELAEAFAWLHDRAPANAERWLRGLYDAVESLEMMPNRCGLARENDAFPEEIRQLL